jgi:hypothetical protein
MRRMPIFLAVSALFIAAISASAQLDDASFLRIDDPAIAYTARQPSDVVAALNEKIRGGNIRLAFDETSGYLPAVLEALGVPVESQIVAFSKTAGQVGLTNPQTPHVIFFNDAVSVGWVRGGFVELAVQDPEQGAIFYDLAQVKTDKPAFVRQNWCLGCHYSNVTMGVPGLLTRSMPTRSDGNTVPYLASEIANSETDHRSPFAVRWGGWYVTGAAGAFENMGNSFVTDDAKSIGSDAPLSQATLEGKADSNAYLTPYSDIVALLVFNHQTHMMNLLTRLGWETRLDLANDRKDLGDKFGALVDEVVDYMLFIDEAPLPPKVKSTSGFSEKFSGEGPEDRNGRSLRQLSLDNRLMRYPCSYMIYSAVFDALPSEARDAVYQRLWRVLSGEDKSPKYSRLSPTDRRAVVDILQVTKKGLPSYFQSLSQP